MNISKYIILTALGMIGCSTHDTTAVHSHRIVFFGDSITEQGDKPGGYVAIVRDSLRSLGVNAEVIGAGISGNKVTDLQQRLQRDVLEKKPTVVVIYIGINDVWHYQFADRGLAGTPKEQFEKILGELIAEIRKNGASVVLTTPSVIGEKHDGTNRWDPMLEEYSQISRRIAGEQGAILLDLRRKCIARLQKENTANAEKGILTNDGVHLNETGNYLVAGEMIGILDGLGLFFPGK